MQHRFFNSMGHSSPVSNANRHRNSVRPDQAHINASRQLPMLSTAEAQHAWPVDPSRQQGALLDRATPRTSSAVDPSILMMPAPPWGSGLHHDVSFQSLPRSGYPEQYPIFAKPTDGISQESTVNPVLKDAAYVHHRYPTYPEQESEHLQNPDVGLFRASISRGTANSNQLPFVFTPGEGYTDISGELTEPPWTDFGIPVSRQPYDIRTVDSTSRSKAVEVSQVSTRVSLSRHPMQDALRSPPRRMETESRLSWQTSSRDM